MVLKEVSTRLKLAEKEDPFFQFSEIPHSGDRIIKPFAWSDTRGAFCLSTGGTKRLVALPYATAQFYSGHTPDDKEMWPIFSVFADIRDAH